ARRVNREGFDIADIGQVAEKLEVLDELSTRFHAALDSEANDGAEFAGAILGGLVMVGTRLEPGILDPGYLVMTFQILGETLRVLAMPFHAKMQGFDALEHEKGVERRDASAGVAKELEAHLQDVGDIGPAERFERLEGIP